MKHYAKQSSLLENDPRKRITKAERPKIRKSNIVMPLTDQQLHWALLTDANWVMQQVGEQ